MKLATIFAKAEGNVFTDLWSNKQILHFAKSSGSSWKLQSRWEFQYSEGISFLKKLRVSILKIKLPDWRYPKYTKKSFSYDSPFLKLRRH